jgi:spermidine synthase
MRLRTENGAILWISVLGLYLELLLIRWIGTEIRIFAYLQNTVLVVCFLGLGIGLFTSERRAPVTRGLTALVMLAALLAIPPSRAVLTELSTFLSVLGEINIWAQGLPASSGQTVLGLTLGLAVTLVVMVLVMEPFIPIGRLLGRLMDEHPQPIVAYSINVAGSLAGIWLFVGLSRLNQPPLVWFLVLAVLGLPWVFQDHRVNWVRVGLLAAVVPLVGFAQASTGAVETIWSPYQRLDLFDVRGGALPQSPSASYRVLVNNTGYQVVLDLSDYGRAGDEGAGRLSTYDIPGLIHPDPSRVLVVGSGTGNDVAGVLRNAPAQVTAVEIDPAILALGRKYHPEHPYDSDRVRVETTDARSFFATTDENYDVVAFGFLDSHTTNALTNARLDHYVYTLESFERVKDLLEPGGIVCVAFSPLRPFIVDRLAGELKRVFGREPLAFYFPGGATGSTGVVLVAGDLETATARIASEPILASLSAPGRALPDSLTYATVPATDDWPYLYLDQPRIPLLFGLLAGILVLLVAYSARTIKLPATMSPRSWGKEAWHFFFLGAAFLLLEVQNISKASVVLGNTWLVNAIIISGVLSMILAANVVVLRWKRIPLGPVYGILLSVVIGLYFIDLASFAFLPFALKAAIVGSLATLPMAFSGIAFARAFETAGRKDHALGANLIGALAGAVLQSMSFVVGIRALLVAVGLLYLAAALTRPRLGTRRLDPESAPVP